MFLLLRVMIKTQSAHSFPLARCSMFPRKWTAHDERIQHFQERATFSTPSFFSVHEASIQRFQENAVFTQFSFTLW